MEKSSKSRRRSKVGKKDKELKRRGGVHKCKNKSETLFGKNDLTNLEAVKKNSGPDENTTQLTPENIIYSKALDFIEELSDVPEDKHKQKFVARFTDIPTDMGIDVGKIYDAALKTFQSTKTKVSKEEDYKKDPYENKILKQFGTTKEGVMPLSNSQKIKRETAHVGEVDPSLSQPN